MTQPCTDPKRDHVPTIERYYDEERPELVKRIFRCSECSLILADDVIEISDDEEGFRSEVGYLNRTPTEH